MLEAQLSQLPSIATRIVERRSGPLLMGQADGVACRSVEMFDAFGLSDRLLREAYWVNETDKAFPGVMRRESCLSAAGDQRSLVPVLAPACGFAADEDAGAVGIGSNSATRSSAENLTAPASSSERIASASAAFCDSMSSSSPSMADSLM